MIIGCDLHTRYQQIAMVDTETGEFVERRLEHESGEARTFYAGLRGAVRVGIEATGHTAWFEAMLAEFGHELWMGDAAKIRAAVVRKQKTDARDAAHLLDMLCTNRFPTIWRPSLAERDLRQLLWHRQKLVWMWGAVKNQMHALAMGEGVCRKKKLFTAKGRTELEGLKLGPWGELSTAGVTADIRRTAELGEKAGPGGGASCEERAAGCASHDSPGSRTDHIVGVRIDHRAGRTLRSQQASGELSGAESAGAQFGRTAAAGVDQ